VPLTLGRTALLMGAAQAVRLVTGLAINKLLAVQLGPSGLALLGQLGNLSGIAAAVGSCGVGVGLTRFVAERGTLEDARREIASALSLIAFASGLVSLALAFGASYVAAAVLGSERHEWVIWTLLASNLLAVGNLALVAILNGRREIGAIAAIAAGGSLITLVLTAGLTLAFSLEGALLAVCLSSGAQGLVVLVHFLRRPELRSWLAGLRPGMQRLRPFLGYAAIAISASAFGPGAVILVRGHIAESHSMEMAGYWQGVWKLSEVYLSFATAVLGTYLLPQLAQCRTALAARAETVKALRNVVPAVAAAALAIYVSRSWIVELLFSAEFAPMADLFAFQLVGDVLKIAAWIPAYVLIARGTTGLFVLLEALFSTSFYLLAVGLSGAFGLVGITYAHAINYLVYLGFVSVAASASFRSGPTAGKAV